MDILYTRPDSSRDDKMDLQPKEITKSATANMGRWIMKSELKCEISEKLGI